MILGFLRFKSGRILRFYDFARAFLPLDVNDGLM